MNSRLLQAILSMDSYNRGYLEGVKLQPGNEVVNTYLGNYKVLLQSDYLLETDGVEAGFYAIAYQYEDAGVTKTVISYRGTDQFLTANGIGGDIVNAYSQGGGDAETSQSVMAIQFYQAVVDAVYGTETGNYNVNGNLNNIMVTGHSMGGGLAGLVGGLYGLDGTVYSNMAYQQALLNLSHATNTTPDQLPNYTDLYSNEFYQLINNTYGPAYNGAINPAWLTSYAPNWSNLEAYTIAGEILNFGFPGGNSGETYPSTVNTPQAGPVALELGTSTGFFEEIDPFDTHNVATLVMRIYAEDLPAQFSDWGLAVPYFWSAAYDNQLAMNIGIGGEYAGRYIAEGGAHGYDKTMRTMIAYSALTYDGSLSEQEARLPFGDTAIRAFFNDADDLGGFLPGAGNSINGGADIRLAASRVFVEYAGKLAQNSVLQVNKPAAVDGIFDYSNGRFHVDFSDSVWQITSSSTLPPTIVYKGGFIKELADGLGLTAAQLQDAIDRTEHVYAAYGQGVYNPSVPSGYDAATYDFSNEVAASNGRANLLVTDMGAGPDYDIVTGTLGDDIILTGTGNDKVFGTAGRDIISLGSGDDVFVASKGGDTVYGGNGIDVIDYSAVTGPMHFSGGIVTTADGRRGGQVQFEELHGSATGQNYFINTSAAKTYGGSANDVFENIGGALYGGDGDDYYNIHTSYHNEIFSTNAVGGYVVDTSSRIVEFSNGGNDTIALAGFSSTTISAGGGSLYTYAFEVNNGLLEVSYVKYDALVTNETGGYHYEFTFEKVTATVIIAANIEFIELNGYRYRVDDFSSASTALFAPPSETVAFGNYYRHDVGQILISHFNEEQAASEFVGGRHADVAYNGYIYGVALNAPDGVHQTAHGSIAIQEDTYQYTYTPNNGFYGEDTYSYTVNGQTVTHRFNVLPSSDHILAENDTYTVEGNKVYSSAVMSTNLLDNDAVTSGSKIALPGTIVTSQNGSVIVDADGNFRYTPPEDFVGIDTFVYWIKGEDGQSTSATVTLNVTQGNRKPAAQFDTFTGLIEDEVFIGGSVLNNDSDPDDNALRVSQYSQAKKGLVHMDENGAFTYTPYLNVTGSDYFEYEVMDSFGAVSKARVNLDVTITNNDAPIVRDVSIGVLDYKSSYNNAIIFDYNERDPDGESLSIVGGTFRTDEGNLVQISSANSANQGSTFTYISDDGYVGEDSFTYIVTDQSGNSAAGTATINVLLPDGGASGTSGSDFLTGGDNGATIFGMAGHDTLIGGVGNDTLSGGRGNDTLVGTIGTDTLHGNSGDDVYVFDLSQPFDGQNWWYTTIRDSSGIDTLVLKGIDLADLNGLNQQSSINITFANGILGAIFLPATSAEVEYLLLDSNKIIDLSTMTQVAVFHMPLAVDDAVTMKGVASLSGNVLADNGSGADIASANNEISVRAGTYITAAGGTVVLQEDGSFLYTPLVDFFGIDSFNYSVFTSAHTGTSATVTINVRPANEAPTALDREFEVQFTSTFNGNVITPTNGAAIVDPEGSSVTAIAGSFTTAHGNIVTILADGSFNYISQGDYLGEDTFEYTVEDVTGLSSAAQVTLNVVAPAGAIVGTQSTEYLYGTSGDDVIYTLAGNDTVYTMGGQDTIHGGSGTDRAWYSDASLENMVIYRTGEDTYNVQKYLLGKTDTLHSVEEVEAWGLINLASLNLEVGGAGWGNPTFTGTGGEDQIFGTRAHDTFYASASNDTYLGGLGTDRVIYSDGYQYHIARTGEDLYTVTGNGKTDSLNAVEVVQVGSSIYTLSELNLEVGGNSFATTPPVDPDMTLYGTSGDDIITAGTGYDDIYASAGNDTIFGQAGNDRMYYADSNALYSIQRIGDESYTVTYNGKTDTLHQVEGIIVGGFIYYLSSMNLTVGGSSYSIEPQGLIIYGTAGADTLVAGQGSDTVYSSEGNDTLIGLTGIDTAVYVDAQNVYTVERVQEDVYTVSYNGKIDMLNAFEHIKVGDATYSLSGLNLTVGTGSYIFTPSADPDLTLSGTSGNDSIAAGSGNDTIYASVGNDYINGYGGNDHLIYGAEKVVYELYRSSESVYFIYYNGKYDVVENVENITIDGTLYDLAALNIAIGAHHYILPVNLTLSGTEASDILLGSVGEDTFFGSASNDLIDGRAGIDTLIYTDPSLAYVVNHTASNVYTVSYAGKTDTLQEVEIVLIDGVSYDLASLGLTIGGAGYMIGTAAPMTLYGTPGNDSIVAGYGDDTIFGSMGNDYIVGGSGSDIVIYGNTLKTFVVGKYGDELYYVYHSDMLDVVTGVEEISVNGVTYQLNQLGLSVGSPHYYIAAPNLVLNGSGGSTLVGGDGNDTFYVASGNNVVSGGGGTNIAIYNDASPIYHVTRISNQEFTITYNGSTDHFTSVHDFRINGVTYSIALLPVLTSAIFGTSGDDVLQGTAANDEIYASIGNDTLIGGNGDDYLSGLNGDDTLIGGLGTDILRGGSGNDTYIFNSFAEAVGDDIADTASGIDTIVINGATFSDLTFWVSNGRQYIGLAVDTSQNFSFLRNLVSQRIEYLVTDGGHVFDLVNMVVVDPGSTNQAPVAQDDTFAGEYGTSITGNVLSNNGNGADSDADNDVLSVTAGTFITANGNTVMLNASGVFTFTALNGFLGQDSFSYTVSDGEETDSGIATITVTAPTGALTGDGAANTLAGTSTDDAIFGLAGDDSLHGGYGNDSLYGGAGADTLQGGYDADYLSGGDGNDRLYGAYSNSLVDNSDDTLEGGLGNDMLWGGGGIDTALYAADSAGFVIYRTATDTYTVVDTNPDGLGTDTLQEGMELVQFNDQTLDLATLNLTVGGEGWGHAAPAQGTSGNDTLIGYAGADALYGLDGDDSLHGAYGNDSLYGGNGLDRLYGGYGADYLSGGDGNDVLYGAYSNSLVDNSDDTLEGGLGNDHLYGGAGIDTALYAADSAGFVIYRTGTNIYVVVDTNPNGLGTDTLQEGMETVQFNDQTLDLAALNLTVGGEGWGHAAPVQGTSGNDTLIGYAGADTLHGLDGDDSLHGAYGNDSLYGGNGLDRLYGGYGADYLNGGDGNDYLYGAYSNSLVDNSDDTLEGGLGNDMLWGGAGNDILDGGEGSDYLYGDINTASNSGDGNDVLKGGAGNDFLYGGGGNDFLWGGDGVDTLNGGDGTDVYVFESSNAFNNIDTIQTFSLAQGDIIDISSLLTGYDPLTSAITDYVLIETSGSNSTLKVDRDGAGSAYGFTQIATVQSVTGLTDEAALVASGNLLVA